MTKHKSASIRYYLRPTSNSKQNMHRSVFSFKKLDKLRFDNIFGSSFLLTHLFQLVSQDLDLFLILVLLLRVLWWERTLFRCRSIYESNSTFDPISISEKQKKIKHTFTFLEPMLMLTNSEKNSILKSISLAAPAWIEFGRDRGYG